MMEQKKSTEDWKSDGLQRVQQGTEFADSDQMKESEESEQENGFQAQSKVSKVGACLATVQKKIIGRDITRRKERSKKGT